MLPTHIRLYETIQRVGHYDASQRADTIGQTHQYAGIAWCDIQMIYIVAGDGKSAESHAAGEREHGARLARKAEDI